MSRTRETNEKETKGTVKKRGNVKLVARGNNCHRSLADPNMLNARRKKKQEESIGFLLFDLNQRYIILYAVAYFLFLLCLCFMILTTVQTNKHSTLMAWPHHNKREDRWASSCRFVDTPNCSGCSDWCWRVQTSKKSLSFHASYMWWMSTIAWPNEGYVL